MHQMSPRILKRNTERVYLVIVLFRVGDEGLEDVVTDCSFLYVSEIGIVCGEVGAHVEPVSALPKLCAAPRSVSKNPSRIIAQRRLWSPALYGARVLSDSASLANEGSGG